MKRAATMALVILAGVALSARVLQAGPGLPPQLDWQHPDLDLYLWSVRQSEARSAFELCVRLKPDADRGSVAPGYPRYRTPEGIWRDAVTLWPQGRRRDLSLWRGGRERECLTVFIAPDSTRLELEAGPTSIRLDPQRWATGFSAEPGTPRDPAPGVPTQLEAALRWEGDKPFGDGALDPEESGQLIVDVFNRGSRVAEDVMLRLAPDRIAGVEFENMVRVPAVDPESLQSVALAFRGTEALADGRFELIVEVREPYGHDAPPLIFELVTRGVPGAELVLTPDFAVEGADLPLPRDTIVGVRLRVRNVGPGPSQGSVTARITGGENVFAAHDTAEHVDLGPLASGEVREILYRCYANQRAEQLEVQVSLWDARTVGQPSRTTLSLPLADGSTSARIVRVDPDPRVAAALAPLPPPLTSEIDRYVPSSASRRPDALAVVLGVERYQTAPWATFAAQDARTAARYFQHALGIPAERMQFLVDDEVSLAQLQRIFGRDGWLARRVHEDTEVFVYFSGHGVAEIESFVPYLLPSDGDPSYIRQTAFPLDRMIEGLADLDALSTTVFLDVCFGGVTREGESVLGNARPLLIVPARHHVAGISVFSASRSNQVASALPGEGHGLFTFSVFRGLGGAADLDGDRLVLASELGEYLMDVVPRAAAALDREQTPSIFLDTSDQVLVRFP